MEWAPFVPLALCLLIMATVAWSHRKENWATRAVREAEEARRGEQRRDAVLMERNRQLAERIESLEERIRLAQEYPMMVASPPPYTDPQSGAGPITSPSRASQILTLEQNRIVSRPLVEAGDGPDWYDPLPAGESWDERFAPTRRPQAVPPIALPPARDTVFIRLLPRVPAHYFLVAKNKSGSQRTITSFDITDTSVFDATKLWDLRPGEDLYLYVDPLGDRQVRESDTLSAEPFRGPRRQ